MSDEFKFPDEQDEIDTSADGGEVEAADELEVDIEVVDDTPEKDRGRKPLDRDIEEPTDEELGAYSSGVQRRIKELTHARHDERRAKEAILREREELARVTQQLISENRSLKMAQAQGTQQHADTYTSAVSLELEAAKRKLKEAHESFDADAIVEAQESLADAKFKAQQAQQFKQAAQQAEKNLLYTEQQQYQAPQQTRQQLDEKTVRWQARNQWFGSPGHEEVTSYALGLHQKLVNSGVDPRSDEYFEQIDARVKGKFPEVFGETESKSNSRRPSTVVAPASRSTSAGKIKLTATQVALAKRLGLTNQQYALEMAKLEKQNG